MPSPIARVKMAAKAKSAATSKAKTSVSKTIKKKKTTTLSASGKGKAKPASKKNAALEKRIKEEADDFIMFGTPELEEKPIASTSTSTESRGAPFRKAPSIRVKENAERAMGQRFVLIDRVREIGPKETFKILGSTANIYTVVIDL